ncbi:MAG TPA: NAD(P)/FAD-dependent oxidoreductase [Acidimicrobiia bacterium]|nr:NAD(P)/FAD-dependent oxidoreductase [Acidimicrobiia bacterium]
MTPSVVIIGGGFAGLTAARALEDRARVTVVSDQNFLLFTPMLAEVASGDLDPRHIITPIRQLSPRARVVSGTVTSVDPDNKTVMVDRPFGLEPIELEGDALIVAPGSVPATYGVEGVEEWGLPFKTIRDALRIRNRVLALMESATEETDRRLTHVAIVGAGYSGAELAAALADMLGSASREFFPSAPRPAVTLIDAVDRVAPTLTKRLSAAAERALTRRGVDLVLGEKVERLSGHAVQLQSGRSVEAETVVWAAGVRPNPLVEKIGLETDRGRLVVDSKLRAAPGVFGMGDAALVPDGRGGISPPTAQFALRQGRYLGKHLPAILAGDRVPDFKYRNWGELVSLGHRNAVGQVLGLSVSGFPGWFLYRSYYLMRLPSMLRKARVALDWTLDLLFPPDVAWLPTSDLGPDVR